MYKDTCIEDSAKVKLWLDGTTLPSISPKQQIDLECGITEEEVWKVIARGSPECLQDSLAIPLREAGVKVWGDLINEDTFVSWEDLGARDRKRRIWADIQAKVNALGVTHRVVDVLRKRWYNLRQRSKEKLAARLEQSRHIGGGSSTVPDSTPLEKLVEGTLLPESVTGVADLDSSDQPASRPAPSTTQPTGSGTLTERPDSGDAGQEQQTDGEDSPVNPRKKQRTNIVRPLLPMEDEAEDSNGNLHSENTLPQQESRPQDSQVPQGTARRRHRTTSNFGDRGDESVFAGLELNMLQVQRLQAKNIKALQ
ncbi:uncharacterized protein LOC144827989 [Lissotriton helveticus]